MNVVLKYHSVCVLLEFIPGPYYESLTWFMIPCKYNRICVIMNQDSLLSAYS